METAQLVAVPVTADRETPAARVAAANAILDRACGKPAQAITGEGGEGPVIIETSNWLDQLSDEDFATFQVLARAHRNGNGTSGPH